MTVAQELLSFAHRNAWLKANHAHATEARLILNKKSTGAASLTFEAAPTEALYFGWTDVKSKNTASSRARLRFTPCHADSVWSMIKIRRGETAIAKGRMMEAGLAPEKRGADKTFIF